MFVFSALSLLLLSGCGSKDCSSLDAGTARDSCLLEQAVRLAESDDLTAAYATIRGIDEPLARASAINAVLGIAPEKVDGNSVLALCNTLPPPYYAPCRKTWERPHLWNNPDERGK